jgi:hypothetical protein
MEKSALFSALSSPQKTKQFIKNYMKGVLQP